MKMKLMTKMILNISQMEGKSSKFCSVEEFGKWNGSYEEIFHLIGISKENLKPEYYRSNFTLVKDTSLGYQALFYHTQLEQA